MSNYSLETLAIHAGQDPEAMTGAVTVPIFQTSTYAQEGLGKPRQGYEYSRTDNPTRKAYEQCFAALEGARFGIAFASGMAATNNCMYLLNSGDEVLVSDDVYGGTFRFFTKVMSKFGVRAHFVNMPKELSEAAKVDGAGTWDLFWKIHVPLARPPIVSLGILMSVWTWNQFLIALVLVDDPKQRTVAGALGAFQGQWATDIPLLCAGSILILLPTLIVFVVFQRQVITALLQGSVKG